MQVFSPAAIILVILVLRWISLHPVTAIFGGDLYPVPTWSHLAHWRLHSCSHSYRPFFCVLFSLSPKSPTPPTSSSIHPSSDSYHGPLCHCYLHSHTMSSLYCYHRVGCCCCLPCLHHSFKPRDALQNTSLMLLLLLLVLLPAATNIVFAPASALSQCTLPAWDKWVLLYCWLTQTYNIDSFTYGINI